MRSRFIYPVSQSLAVLVFALSVAGPIGAVGHVHHGNGDHAAVHSNLVCIWMCAASSFVGPDGNHPSVLLTLIHIAEIEPVVPILGDVPLSFQSRAPPVSL